MPIYNPPPPWQPSQFGDTTTDEFGTEWEIAGENKVAKPPWTPPTVENAEDCCTVLLESTDDIVIGEATSIIGAPAAKTDGDTAIQCHPNGLSSWTCVNGAWQLSWVKVIADQLTKEQIIASFEFDDVAPVRVLGLDAEGRCVNAPMSIVTKSMIVAGFEETAAQPVRFLGLDDEGNCVSGLVNIPTIPDPEKELFKAGDVWQGTLIQVTLSDYSTANIANGAELPADMVGCLWLDESDGTQGYIPSVAVRVCQPEGVADPIPYSGQPVLHQAQISLGFNSPGSGPYSERSISCSTPIVKIGNFLRGAPEHDRRCVAGGSGVQAAGDPTPLELGENEVATSPLVSITNVSCRRMNGTRVIESKVRVQHFDGLSSVVTSVQQSLNGGAFGSAENDSSSNTDGQRFELVHNPDSEQCLLALQVGEVYTLQAKTRLNVLGPNVANYADATAFALIDISTARV